METSTSKKTIQPPPVERYVRPIQETTYDVNIDFDAATAAWMRNKIPYSACMSYRCQAVKSDGKPCKKRALEPKLTLNPQPFLCSSHIYSWHMNRGAMRLVDYGKQEE